MILAPPSGDTPPPGTDPGRLLALCLLVFLACIGIAVALPHPRYLRFQQLAATPMRPAAWIYERIHYDRTPIDVAIIGASRTQVGISAPALERALTARLGRPVHVANLSLPQDGRDLHYAITRELLSTHPEVKLILFSLTEHAARTSHPAFRSLADTGDILDAPLLLNPDYLANLAYLPYRQLSLFLQARVPGVAGVHADFRPALYWSTHYDTTLSYRAAAGHWVDRDSIRPAAQLARSAARQVAIRTPVFLPRSARSYEYAVERSYTRAIAALAEREGVRIGFLYSPIYAHVLPIDDLSFYRARGFVLDAGFLAADHRNYSDYAHLNRIGSTRLTAALARQLVAMERAGRVELLAKPERY